LLKLQHAIPFLLLLAGCAVRQRAPRAWRFADRTLIPPGVTSPDLAERTFKATIAVRPNCLESDALTIERRRSSITVTVHREALLRQPRGWLAEWVDRAESQGCITHGQGSLLFLSDPDLGWAALISSKAVWGQSQHRRLLAHED
jgi:hypothetical protein